MGLVRSKIAGEREREVEIAVDGAVNTSRRVDLSVGHRRGSWEDPRCWEEERWELKDAGDVSFFFFFF